MTDALFDGAPSEPEVVHKERGKILRWRQALLKDVCSAVDDAKTELALSRRKNKTNPKLILRFAKKMFPKWCKRKPYQVKLFNRMLKEQIGIIPKPAQDMKLFDQRQVADLEF